MNLTEKVAYIKGLVEGLGLDESKKEVKVINAIIDVLSDLSETLAEVDGDVDQLYDSMDVLNDDLADMESYVYGDEEEKDEEGEGHHHHHHGCSCGCEEDAEDAMYEITCPACGNTVMVDEDTLFSTDLSCPACGEKFELDFGDDEDLMDEEEEELEPKEEPTEKTSEEEMTPEEVTKEIPFDK